ncbi:hypothetical protein QZM03_27440 [Burkholderia multivorans]|nr:hypothetical protein [Burkholderia multivorans]
MSTIELLASSSTPDYTDPAFRGALMTDHWSRDDYPALTTIPTALIADISRASNAVKTIARIVHNSLCEPDASVERPHVSEDTRTLLK